VTEQLVNVQKPDSGPGKLVIQLANVHLRLNSLAGRVDVLRGINLDLLEGHSVAIVGPSGSGKSSLLMIIGGLEQATSGKVRVVDRNFSAMNEDELAAVRGREIGIVFQSFHLIPTMTALENVAMPLELTGHSSALPRARALLQDVGLANRLQHYPAQLSGGEQQRVALARALAPNPRLLLADEPTGNLDKITGAGVMELIFDLQRRSGAALVIVTHDEMLASKCDSMIRIEDGRIVRKSNTAGSR
jgi:putative ABC transport system ATP-binding protein